MTHLLCLLRGHWRTPVVFATSRFYRRRCSLALAPDPLPEPKPDAEPTAQPMAATRRPTRPARAASKLVFALSRLYAGPSTSVRGGRRKSSRWP
jgi:hypothetical protein